MEDGGAQLTLLGHILATDVASLSLCLHPTRHMQMVSWPERPLAGTEVSLKDKDVADTHTFSPGPPRWELARASFLLPLGRCHFRACSPDVTTGEKCQLLEGGAFVLFTIASMYLGAWDIEGAQLLFVK